MLNPFPLQNSYTSLGDRLLEMNYQAASEDQAVSQSFLCSLPALLVRPPGGKRLQTFTPLCHSVTVIEYRNTGVLLLYVLSDGITL